LRALLACPPISQHPVRDRVHEAPVRAIHRTDYPLRANRLRNVVGLSASLKKAIHVGERIYSEPPKAFRRRMKRDWSACRALAQARLELHPAGVAAATRELEPS
jgi:hypothetical protein